MSFFSAEWTYLLTERKVGDEDSAFSYVRIKYGDHETDTVTGTIIYPDDFSFSEVGVAALKFGVTSGAQAELDKATWEALEAAGCVFFPWQSSVRINSGVLEVTNEWKYGMMATYYSSQAVSAQDVYGVDFGHISSLWQLVISNNNQRRNRYHVRLAQDL